MPGLTGCLFTGGCTDGERRPLLGGHHGIQMCTAGLRRIGAEWQFPQQILPESRFVEIT